MGGDSRIGKCCCDSYDTKVAIAYHYIANASPGQPYDWLYLIKSDLSTYQKSIIDSSLSRYQYSPWIMKGGSNASILHAAFYNYNGTASNAQIYWYEGNDSAWTKRTAFNARSAYCLPGINPDVAHGFSGVGTYTTFTPTVVHPVTRRYISGAFTDEVNDVPNSVQNISPGGIRFDSNGYERVCAWNTGGTAHVIWRYTGSTTWTASTNVPNTYALAYAVYNDNDYVLSYNSTTQKIQLSIWNGSSWTTSDVVSETYSAVLPSLYIDSSGVCYISYVRYDRNATYNSNGYTYNIYKTYYGNNSGGTFAFELVNEQWQYDGSSGYRKSQINVCADGTPIIIQEMKLWSSGVPSAGVLLRINSKVSSTWNMINVASADIACGFETFDSCAY